MKPADLEKEISEARRSISSDGYAMSIGEITNLYRDGELIIRPEFQRLFRWTSSQKSRLVESLLLGIPLPSIFVSQAEAGNWELVDGLQRISTILQLQGELKGQSGVVLPALELEATKYLPSLAGRTWHNDDKDKSLTEAQRLDVKRSKIDVKIIKRESSPATKFDLFQRLNSYGTSLTPQELRSAMLVAVSGDFFSWLEGLTKLKSFETCVTLSERLMDERFDLELVVRFLVLHDWPTKRLSLSNLRDLPKILDDESVQLATNFPMRADELEQSFRSTFDFIAARGGEDVFRKWDRGRRMFVGPFLSTAFEVFALGIGYQFSQRAQPRDDLLEIVKEFWSKPEMSGGFATGKSTERRLVDYIPVGRAITASAPHQA